MLFYCQRVVSPTFDCGIVGHDHDGMALDLPYPGNNASGWNDITVRLIGRELRQFKECRPWVNQKIDSVPDK